MKQRNRNLKRSHIFNSFFISALIMLSSCQPSKESKKESEETEPRFKISLAQWSLHKSFFGDGLSSWEHFGELWDQNPGSVLRGTLDPLDFPRIAKEEFGFDAVEYVNVFYFSKKNDLEFWKAMRAKCDSLGVKSLLIMCDREGNLGDADSVNRQQAVENHYGWVDAAVILGCHSIRVNAAGAGTAEEVKQNAIDGLKKLTAYASQKNINVIVENHGGYSSDGKWLADVITQVGSSRCGTLPDFGNFCIKSGTAGCEEEYDRYLGVAELLPFAKGVSGKSHDFDLQGNEIHTDFTKMLKIVKASSFSGYIDVEYEGSELSEAEGIRTTKKLIASVLAELK